MRAGCQTPLSSSRSTLRHLARQERLLDRARLRVILFLDLHADAVDADADLVGGGAEEVDVLDVELAAGELRRRARRSRAMPIGATSTASMRASAVAASSGSVAAPRIERDGRASPTNVAAHAQLADERVGDADLRRGHVLVLPLGEDHQRAALQRLLQLLRGRGEELAPRRAAMRVSMAIARSASG